MNKIPFFQRIVKSIKDPYFIAHAPKEKTNTAMLYIILLLLLVSIPSGIARGVLFTNEMSDLLSAVEGPNFPDFQFSDGKFTMNSSEPIIIQQGSDLIVIIDITGESTINDLAGYSTGYLLTQDVITITMTGQAPTYYKLSTFSNLEFNKTIFADQLRFINKLSVFIIPIIFIVYTIIATFFRSFMLLLLGFFMKRLLLIEHLRGSELYKMVLFSMTLGILLYQIVTLIPLIVTIPFGIDLFFTFAPVVLFYIPSTTILSRGLKLFKVMEESDNLKSKL